MNGICSFGFARPVFFTPDAIHQLLLCGCIADSGKARANNTPRAGFGFRPRPRSGLAEKVWLLLCSSRTVVQPKG